MQTVKFSGVIAPADSEINAHGNLNWKDHNLEFALTYEIRKSRMEVECKAASITEPDVHFMYLIVSVHMRGVIDAIAFKIGLGLMPLFTECILPGTDTAIPLHHGNTDLGSLCTLSGQEVVDAITKERRLMKPLNDLTDTLFEPSDARVNVQRAIEGLSHLLSKETDDRDQRWQNLRMNLNLSRSYVQFITDSSKKERHGHTGPVLMRENGDLQERGWKIMNRFLEFSKCGNINLSEPGFPLL